MRREKEEEEIVVLSMYMIERNEARTALCRQELDFVWVLFFFYDYRSRKSTMACWSRCCCRHKMVSIRPVVARRLVGGEEKGLGLGGGSYTSS